MTEQLFQQIRQEQHKQTQNFNLGGLPRAGVFVCVGPSCYDGKSVAGHVASHLWQRDDAQHVIVCSLEKVKVPKSKTFALNLPPVNCDDPGDARCIESHKPLESALHRVMEHQRQTSGKDNIVILLDPIFVCKEIPIILQLMRTATQLNVALVMKMASKDEIFLDDSTSPEMKESMACVDNLFAHDLDCVTKRVRRGLWRLFFTGWCGFKAFRKMTTNCNHHECFVYDKAHPSIPKKCWVDTKWQKTDEPRPKISSPALAQLFQELQPVPISAFNCCSNATVPFDTSVLPKAGVFVCVGEHLNFGPCGKGAVAVRVAEELLRLHEMKYVVVCSDHNDMEVPESCNLLKLEVPYEDADTRRLSEKTLKRILDHQKQSVTTTLDNILILYESSEFFMLDSVVVQLMRNAAKLNIAFVTTQFNSAELRKIDYMFGPYDTEREGHLWRGWFKQVCDFATFQERFRECEDQEGNGIGGLVYDKVNPSVLFKWLFVEQ